MRYFRWISAALAAVAVAGCATQAPSSSLGIRVPETGHRSGISAPSDMWERIRKGFAMQDLDNSIVRDKEAYYAQRPEYIGRMIGRSNKYLYHVVEELERRRMPTELALLPFVESAFNPQAVSSAKAAGMWQFIPSTGKYFSLNQNAFRDDRRDVVKSTRAALDYLQKLYGMFGDWHLALAAYNWGEGSVQRAIARNQAAGLGTRYEDLTMPNETREYVPKLQAIKNIVRNPATFNTALPNVANHPYFEKVPIRRDMDVTVAAQLAEISVDDFKALNPAMNKPLVIASVTPNILLPWASVETFKTNLAAAGDKRLASWTVWVAPSTMPVAQAAQQAGASEEELRSINRIPPRMLVKAGSSLLVPRPDGQAAEIPSHVANAAAGVSLAPEAPKVVLRRTTVTARKGDTLATLAARYGLSAATVAEWNNASARQKLRPGQAVALHLPQNEANRRAQQQRIKLARAAQDEDEEDTKPAKRGSKAQAAKTSAKNRRSARNEEDAQPSAKASAKNRRAADDANEKPLAKGKAAAKPGKAQARSQDKDEAPARTAKTAKGQRASQGRDDGAASAKAKPAKGADKAQQTKPAAKPRKK